jgi:hypothetical protein
MAITDCEYIVISYVEFTNHFQFRNAMMTQRSNTSTRVRKQAGPSIFGCTAADLKSSQERYEKFKERIGWVVRQDGSKGYETWAVEILHKNYNGRFDINCVFLNPVLMKVGQVYRVRLVMNIRLTCDWASGFCCSRPWPECSDFVERGTAHEWYTE